MRIEARGISAGYGQVELIRAVDVQLHPGELVGLVGPNGAGKSTLLRALSRTLPLNSGELFIGGCGAESMTAREVARQIAFVRQLETPLFDFSVREVVLMGRNPYVKGLAAESREDFAQAARAMAQTDTLQLADRPITELSGGELRRVLIARSLAQATPTLLLDEPTAHLDLGHQSEILTTIRKRVDTEGVSCIAALHDLNLASAYCHRLILLTDGRILAQGQASDVLRKELLTRAFGPGIRVSRNEPDGSPLVFPSSPQSEPITRNSVRVHVVCGGGTGAEILSLLHRRGHVVTAGVLNRTDSDQLTCEALGIEAAVEEAFSPINDAAAHAGENLLDLANIVVVTDVPFGTGNLRNLTLVRLAQERGKPIMLVAPHPIELRDFAQGRARELWEQIKLNGAREARDANDVGAMIKSINDLEGDNP